MSIQDPPAPISALASQRQFQRRLPIGAEVQPEGGVHFRVWAPKRQRVAVVVADQADPGVGLSPRFCVDLEPEADGYFSGFVGDAVAGARYGYRLDGDEKAYPDPAARWQPDGPHEMSAVVDPASFEWHDEIWPGPTRKGQVVYELHIGTFTSEGSFAAGMRELPYLAELGVTLVEVMPVAEFSGRFGWGYDGVDQFAPTRLYGAPDDFRRFVDEAHRCNVGVILDVVYNHFGPTGNYLAQFSDHYTSKKHHTDWGDAINFDAADCEPVREFFLANAGYWIDEFHIDGLRLDAVHAIVDDSREHILAAIGRRVRRAAGNRRTLVFAENEFQDARLLRSCDEGGYDLDAAWNDDFHHSARVAMTGHAEYYYADYHGTPQELISAMKWGYLYQGQWNARQHRRRGSPAVGLGSEQFVNFLQNHDQVGNSALGRRSQQLTSPGRHRAMTALLLLAPGTPLLFQGQEFNSSSPFLYFADHDVELGELVRQGRQESLRQFRSLAGPDVESYFVDPCDEQTFLRCKLKFDERERHTHAMALHRDLLQLRREDPVFSSQRGDRMFGAVLGPEALALRLLGESGDDRLLIVNMGRDLAVEVMTEPLLAPPAGFDWTLLWASEDPRYGGSGSGVLNTRQWYFPGHAAVVLKPRPVAQ
jgi:maltooligosyltrehalose trehalohydrolase